ncbi:hypothetical protein [Paenibacillus sp. FSL L8-0463]|uniref:hypothetical protein n=1 Tax=Paenibacillus sp. FSL L8-0463 TaxID=2954687 RepID=UPI00311A08DD
MSENNNKKVPQPGVVQKRSNDGYIIERKIYSVDKTSARISTDSNSSSDSKKK